MKNLLIYLMFFPLPFYLILGPPEGTEINKSINEKNNCYEETLTNSLTALHKFNDPSETYDLSNPLEKSNDSGVELPTYDLNGNAVNSLSANHFEVTYDVSGPFSNEPSAWTCMAGFEEKALATVATCDGGMLVAGYGRISCSLSSSAKRGVITRLDANGAVLARYQSYHPGNQPNDDGLGDHPDNFVENYTSFNDIIRIEDDPTDMVYPERFMVVGTAQGPYPGMFIIDVEGNIHGRDDDITDTGKNGQGLKVERTTDGALLFACSENITGFAPCSFLVKYSNGAPEWISETIVGNITNATPAINAGSTETRAAVEITVTDIGNSNSQQGFAVIGEFIPQPGSQAQGLVLSVFIDPGSPVTGELAPAGVRVFHEGEVLTKAKYLAVNDAMSELAIAGIRTPPNNTGSHFLFLPLDLPLQILSGGGITDFDNNIDVINDFFVGPDCWLGSSVTHRAYAQSITWLDQGGWLLAGRSEVSNVWSMSALHIVDQGGQYVPNGWTYFDGQEGAPDPNWAAVANGITEFPDGTIGLVGTANTEICTSNPPSNDCGICANNPAPATPTMNSYFVAFELPNNDVCLSVSVQVDANNCANATVYNGQAPFLYLWDDGTSGSELCGLTAGTNYTVTVRDATGSTAVGFLSTEADLELTIIEETTTDCLEALPSGGAGCYTYLWSFNDETGYEICDLTAGEYCVTVTDALGNETSSCTTIGGGCPPLDPGFTWEQIGSCENYYFGFTPNQYEGVVSFEWDFGFLVVTGDDDPGVNFPAPGTYEVAHTIVDACENEYVYSTTIEVNCGGGECPPLDPGFTWEQIGRCENYYFGFTPNQYEGVVSFEWDFGFLVVTGDDDPGVTFPSPGDYDVTHTVVDICGEEYSVTITVVVPDCEKGKGNGENSASTERVDDSPVANVFLIHPNPAKVSVNIQLDIKVMDGIEIVIFNETGVKVVQQKLESASNQLSTQDWSSGVYLVKILQDGKPLHQEKLVVIK